MIEIKTESIEAMETVADYEELAENSNFDITASNGRVTATKNLR